MMHSIVDVMKRTPKWRFYLLLACLLLIVSELTAAEADAGSWMYYRSYFTDSPPGGPPNALVPNLQSRWVYRRPIRGTGYGIFSAKRLPLQPYLPARRTEFRYDHHSRRLV
jgi:hypothetical protein